MKLQRKLWFGMSFAYLLLFLSVEYVSYREARAHLDEDAAGAVRYIGDILASMQAVYQNWFLSHAVAITDDTVGLMPAHSISRIAANFAARSGDGITFNAVSDRPRNPGNQADALELQAMAWFREHRNARERAVRYVDAEGRTRFHYARPIWIEPSCLGCHGNRTAAPEMIRLRYDSGYDYQPGDLRGIVSIKLPMQVVEQRAEALWLRDMLLHLGVLGAALLVGWLLFNQFVIRRLGQFCQAVERIAQGDYGARIAVRGADELASLGQAFNRMIDAVKVREQSLREKENHIHLLLDSTAEAIYGTDLEGRCTFVNPQFLRLLGYADEQDVIGRHIHDLIHHSHADGSTYPRHDCRAYSAFRTGIPCFVNDEVFWRRDGTAIPVEYWSYPIKRGVDIVGTVVTFFDVSEKRLAETKLHQAAMVIDNTLDGVVVTDPTGRITAVNRAFCQITGYTEADAVGKTPSLLRSGRHDPAFYQAMWHNLLTYGQWQGEIWNRRKDGEVYPEWLNISAIRSPTGHVHNYVAVFTDISTIKQAEARLEHLAHHDHLTNLPNRLLLHKVLDQSIARARRIDGQLAVLFLDIDRFKTINDSLGHAVGDELLKAVAQRLKFRLRGVDTLARLGGDEFVVILEQTCMQDALAVCEDLLDLLKQSFMLSEGQEIFIGGSIGICLYPGDGDNAEDLLRNADTAMYQAKEAGRNTWRIYTEDLTRNANEKLSLECRMRLGLDRNEFHVLYQPQVDTASGRLVGVEALLRWNDSETGAIPPDRFIPLAEETGFIQRLGDWVLRQACAQAKAWQDQGLPPIRMAVNLSSRQFARHDLAESIKRILGDLALSPDVLELEITEGAIMQQGLGAENLLKDLKSLGIGIAIDDFGTGYSSLAYLKRFPIDKLKIDRSFIRDLPGDAQDIEITATIILLARHLGLSVLAEGVETEAQRAFLEEKGCGICQGFLFSRPVPAETIEAMLK